MSALKEYLEKIKGAHEKLERLIEEIMELDPANHDNLERELEQYTRTYLDTSEALQTCLIDLETRSVAPAPSMHSAPSVAHGAVAPSAHKPKPNRALKPDVLTREHTPVELRA